MTAVEPVPAVEKPKPVAKQAAPRRLSHWEPDPRWSHPLAGGLWLYTVAVIVTWPGIGIPPYALAVVAPAGIFLAINRSRRTYPEREFGIDVAASMAWLGGVASVAAAALLVFAAMTSPWQILPWLALLTVWFGGWYAILRTGAPKIAEKVAEEREAARREAITAAWQELLEDAGLGLRIVETLTTRAGYALGVEPKDPRKPVSFVTLQSKMGDLTTRAAAALAREGITLGSGGIRAEETEAAHVHIIHVCTKHILRESIEFVPFEGAPGTIADPLDYALAEDGPELTVTFGGEQGGVGGIIVGATGSGKSRVENSMIGRVGECGDVLVGVIGSAKLVPAVYPWIKPWLEGKSERPAIDFVAGQDPAQVLLMLAGIYELMCHYNDQLSNVATHTPTPERPGWVVFVEETGDMVTQRLTVTLHDGRTVRFSELLNMILSKQRSAQGSMMLLNQMALYDAFGDYGPHIQRNTPFRICLKTLTASDGMNTLPGVPAAYGDTTRLRHNSMLVQPPIEEPRVMPAKAYNLGLPNGGAIEPIAIRNGSWRPDVDEFLGGLLGDIWTERWHAARLPELAAAAARDGLEWPVGELPQPEQPEDDMDVALRNMIDMTKSSDPALQKDVPPPAAPTVEPGGWPNVEDDIAELTAIARKPALTLPEPLQSVMKLLTEVPAPKDWISTQQLAILLDRVTADAPLEERKEAARKLGRELAAIHPDIRATPKDRLQGFEVPELKKTAARIARGEK